MNHALGVDAMFFAVRTTSTTAQFQKELQLRLFSF
jgi:hypothetical protein